MPESTAEGDTRLRTLYWRPNETRPGRILVCSAGTADQSASDECVATLRAYGFRPDVLSDCGVAGVHRVLASFDDLLDADAVVVIAGMEGALASLVGGLTPAPVIAVPTSAGYGAALEGVDRSLGDARLVCGGSECRRHRQRFWCGLRSGPDPAMKRGPADRLVQLFLWHLRGHDPRQPRRRRG